MSSMNKVAAKRTYSRIQEGPWTSLEAKRHIHEYADIKSKKPKIALSSSVGRSMRPKIRPSRLPPTPEERNLIADPHSGMPGSPLGAFSISIVRELKKRSTSEPPPGLAATSRRAGATPSSLVETIAPATQPFNRRASVPYLPGLPQLVSLVKEPASQATFPLLVRQDSTSTTLTDFSNPASSLESRSIISSAPTSPAASTSIPLPSDDQFVGSTQQLIEFSKRTSHGGRHGEWSTEKKEILCAYFLGNSFPNMTQRKALGKQVGLETLQVSKFFSRTRSEVKYSRTTLRDLALQASFGLQFVGAESPSSSASTDPLALPQTSAVSITESLPAPAPTPNTGRAPGRGRGRGRGRGTRGGRGGLGPSKTSRLEASPPSASHPQMTPTLGPCVRAGSTPDSPNAVSLDQESYHTGPVTSSVQEAARSLMSISCARLPVLRGGPPLGVCAPTARYAQTNIGNLSPELMDNVPSSHASLKTGHLKSIPALVVSRDEKPYLAYHSRTTSLFGPDARTLPPPPSHGHPGSPRLSYSPTCPSGVRARAMPADSLALAADIFLSVNGICTFP